jgi:hypothetical protein
MASPFGDADQDVVRLDLSRLSNDAPGLLSGGLKPAWYEPQPCAPGAADAQRTHPETTRLYSQFRGLERSG